MSSDEHIRRLARELVLPDEADLVVQKPKYWSPAFCWLYFERCDALIWEAPESGLVVAEVCPELVSLTEKQARRPQGRLRLRALAVLGTAYQTTDEPDRAEALYKRAFELIRRSKSIFQSDAANVLFRFSYVLCVRHRDEQAVEVASQSIGIYREAPKDIRQRRLGEALLARGYVHHRNGCLDLAMKDWAEAVSCADEKRAPRIFYTAVHNLALGMMKGGVPARDLCRVERYVTCASRSFTRKLLSVPKLKVCWVRGMIQMRFGSTRRGEASYKKAMDGFLQLGEILDVALLSVTLGKRLHQEGRLEELKDLAIETNTVCERLCEQDAVRRVVLIWKQTIVAGTVTAGVFATTWRVLEKASFERAANLTPDVSALPPRMTVHVCTSTERQTA